MSGWVNEGVQGGEDRLAGCPERLTAGTAFLEKRDPVEGRALAAQLVIWGKMQI